jgi:hypothetical protein
MGVAADAKPPRSMATDGEPRPSVPVMTVLSFLALTAGVMFAFLARRF